MPHVDVHLECAIHDSFRVRQIAGMFDVPLAAKVAESFAVDAPDLEGARPWRIGLIVGPSGSGKSTVARRLFGESLYAPRPWPADRAVIDGLGDLPTRRITELFTAVGFSSPPSWIKPFDVLSGGEQFRCELARALADAIAPGDAAAESSPLRLPIVAFDEFTSVVDRQVAKFGSAAIAKAVRKDLVPCRFVAVTCHYDVAEWLEPDWVLDMAIRTTDWRRLRRPVIRLEVARCQRSLWSRFARHHYLSGQLGRGARCFAGLIDGEPVAFCATLACIGRRGHWRISRIVTLPDFQGMGVGMSLAESVAEQHIADGHRLNITASHPAVIGHCRRSSRWKAISFRRGGKRPGPQFDKSYQAAAGRAVVSFEFGK